MKANHRSFPFGVPALVAAASLAFSPAAWSLGLGDVKVESFLNQPLRARIDLITQESDDLESVIARLASTRDYELIGASRESVPVPISFSVEDLDGDAYILATSNLPVGEPIVRLIVEVSWSSGRMLREYTLFLDPPVVPDAAPAPRVDQRRAGVPAAATPPAAPAPSEASADAPSEAPARPTAVPSGAEYGPVQSGQTLWSIASDWSRGSGLDINRVMLAIQRENPDAFLNDNINLLKRGAILRMPERSEVEAITTAAAYREVAAQEEAFTGRRVTDTVVSPETPLLAEEAASAPIERAPEPAPAPADEPEASADAATEPAVAAVPEPVDEVPDVEESRDVLELVPPSPEGDLDGAYGFEETEQGAAVDSDAEALRENLARTEEELINQQQQNAYLEERIRELESQLESADETGVADADMANMEARLQEQRQAEARARAEAAEQPWYSRLWVWLIGLVVVAAAVAGWLFSRRGQDGLEGVAASTGDSLRDIKTEAEDVLRVLSDKDSPKAAEGVAPEPQQRSGDSADEAEDLAPEPAGEKSPSTRFGANVDDAELLDEESSDPEIQLDLARAYISMGDREAARVILEEVVNNGSDTQQAEARKMLEIL
jgi:pilus assembly protein FimV